MNRAEEELGYKALEKGNPAEAFKHFSSTASRGSPFANVVLGLMHQVGLSVPKDIDLAEEFFRRAVEANDPEAKFYLGRLLVESASVEAGLDYLRQAAQEGESRACVYLGRCTQIGWEERKAWLRKGREQGNLHCRVLLARFLMDEGGVLNWIASFYLFVTAFVFGAVRAIRIGDERKLPEDPAFHR